MATLKEQLVAEDIDSSRTFYEESKSFNGRSRGVVIDYLQDDTLVSAADLPDFADAATDTFPGTDSVPLSRVRVNMVGGSQALRIATYDDFVRGGGAKTRPQIETEPKQMTTEQWLLPDGSLNKEPANTNNNSSQSTPQTWDAVKTVWEIRIPFRLSNISPVSHVKANIQSTNSDKYTIVDSNEGEHTYNANELLMLPPLLAERGPATTSVTGWWRLLARADGWTRERLDSGGSNAGAGDVSILDMFIRTTFPDLEYSDGEATGFTGL